MDDDDDEEDDEDVPAVQAPLLAFSLISSRFGRKKSTLLGSVGQTSRITLTFMRQRIRAELIAFDVERVNDCIQQVLSKSTSTRR